MFFRRAILIAVFILVWALSASAQKTDYHFQIGMKPDRSGPLQHVDMSWAKEGPFGPEDGRKIHVFVFEGNVGRSGFGQSRELPVELRRGSERILMFEEGNWQPLRPIGINYGPELHFALQAAQHWAGETVGILLTKDVPFQLVAEAATQSAPCVFLARIYFGEGEMVPEVTPSVRAGLGSPDLVEVDCSHLAKTLSDPVSVDEMEFVGETVFNKVQELIKNKDE